MTDTKKLDAVMKEFSEVVPPSPFGSEREERMAAEIVRLRCMIAADEANRKTTLAHFGLLEEFGHHGCDTLQWVCDALVSERDRHVAFVVAQPQVPA